MTNQCRHLELLRREDGKYWDCGGCGERFTLVPFAVEPGDECPHPSTEAELNAEQAARYRWLRERVRAVYDINGEPVQIVYPKRSHPQLEGWRKRLDVAIDKQIETEARLNREYNAQNRTGDSNDR